MKKLLLGFLALFAFAAQAQIVPSIPYTLTNGSLADATQVMGNFNTIVTDVNANAATNGANTNITAITGLTTPLANTYGGTVIYTGGTTGGSANAQTLVTVVPSNFALTAGNIVTGKAGFSNSGSMTLNVNAQGATQVAIATTLGLASAITGDVVTGQEYLWTYDGTYFELTNPSNQLPLMSGNTALVNNTNGNATAVALALASNSVLGAAAANIVDIALSSSQVLGVGSSGGLQGLTLSSTFNAGPGTLAFNMFPLSSSLSGDVTLTNQSTYYDGPAVAQGTVGTWCAAATVTLFDSGGTATMNGKLWDGTTIIATSDTVASSNANSMTLFGCLASPAGNLRMSISDATRGTTGAIKYNLSGLGKDATITAIRIQ